MIDAAGHRRAGRLDDRRRAAERQLHARSSTGICRRLVGGRRAGRPLRAVHQHAAPERRRPALHLDAREGRRHDARRHDRAVLDAKSISANPLPTVTAKQVSIRRRLNNPRLLARLRHPRRGVGREGFSDYLAQPLVFTDR